LPSSTPPPPQTPQKEKEKLVEFIHLKKQFFSKILGIFIFIFNSEIWRSLNPKKEEKLHLKNQNFQKKLCPKMAKFFQEKNKTLNLELFLKRFPHFVIQFSILELFLGVV
jgi:hypothetical protein